MNEHEQRIAIAEARGWRWYRQPASGPWAKKPMRSLYHPELMKLNDKPFDLADMTERECNPRFMWREGLIPDYLHDLNAMHEASYALKGRQVLDYVNNLWEIVAPGADWDSAPMGTFFAFTNATAAQRAEAFLRAIGKWKGSES